MILIKIIKFLRFVFVKLTAIKKLLIWMSITMIRFFTINLNHFVV